MNGPTPVSTSERKKTTQSSAAWLRRFSKLIIRLECTALRCPPRLITQSLAEDSPVVCGQSTPAALPAICLSSSSVVSHPHEAFQDCDPCVCRLPSFDGDLAVTLRSDLFRYLRP